MEYVLGTMWNVGGTSCCVRICQPLDLGIEFPNHLIEWEC